MTETGLPTLATRRLVLRPLDDSDAESLLSLYGNEDFMRYSGMDPWLSQDDAMSFLARAIAQAREGSAIRMAILLDDQFIGTCSLVGIDHKQRRCELGYGLARAHWGHGFASEAVEAMLEMAFRRLEIRRIQANVDPQNMASIKILERVGFQQEGTLREHLLTSRGPADSAIFGLLDREWLERVSP